MHPQDELALLLFQLSRLAKAHRIWLENSSVKLTPAESRLSFEIRGPAGDIAAALTADFDLSTEPTKAHVLSAELMQRRLSRATKRDIKL